LSSPIHPLQAILLASVLPLFFGAMVTDIAYARSFEVQWKNFASWLLVSGLTLSFIVLLWALVDLLRRNDDRGVRRMAYVGALLVMWIIGFVNALVHAGDVWASMPQGLILSTIGSLLAIAAVWIGFPNYRNTNARMPT
jgi:uncharacterized membrane protein